MFCQADNFLVILFYFIFSYFILFHFIFILFYFILFYSILFYFIMLCYVILYGRVPVRIKYWFLKKWEVRIWGTDIRGTRCTDILLCNEKLDSEKFTKSSGTYDLDCKGLQTAICESRSQGFPWLRNSANLEKKSMRLFGVWALQAHGRKFSGTRCATSCGTRAQI